MKTSKPIVRTTVSNISGIWKVQKKEEEKDLRNSTISPTNILKMRLNDWLLLIPDYDGQAHTLEHFSTSVRYVAKQIGPKAERILLLALGIKLRNRALDYFHYQLHRYTSIEEFLLLLHAQFSGVGFETMLLDKLRHIRQYNDESIDSYANRINKIFIQLNTIYNEDKSSDMETKEANKKFIKECTLSSFRRGLKSIELEARVSACEPKNLDDAISTAIAIENEMKHNDKLFKDAYEESYCSTQKKRRYK